MSDFPQFVREAKDAPHSGMVIWLDYMKFGVVSVAELNNTIEMVTRVLGALPDNAVAFIIAPQSTSERRSGLRDEWRLENWWILFKNSEYNVRCIIPSKSLDYNGR